MFRNGSVLAQSEKFPKRVSPAWVQKGQFTFSDLSGNKLNAIKTVRRATKVNTSEFLQRYLKKSKVRNELKN